MKQIRIKNRTRTRIPTNEGEFQLCYYQNNVDDKEHLALLFGDIFHTPNPIVRIHSECFTGDVLGSLRCDCGPQLKKAMQMIAAAGAGVIVYLRQEGRGIGLLNKMRAYNLMDMGYDTVDANLILGHEADERDYSIGGLILKELGIQSVQLLTNNPHKIESLENLGIAVSKRLPIVTAVQAENEAYLQTKVDRMRHILNMNSNGSHHSMNGHSASALENGRLPHDFGTEKHPPQDSPQVTLSYAQSLDGSITVQRGHAYPISGAQSLIFTHRLRAANDAILVGIGTVLSDNPLLTVRLVEGNDPQPVILDTHLQFPPTARLFSHPSRQPWIFCADTADPAATAALTAAGARIFTVGVTAYGRLDLQQVLATLSTQQIQTLMVEGGAEVITSFLQAGLVHRVALTIAPTFLGGLKAVDQLSPNRLPHLKNVQKEWLGEDLIMTGDVVWPQ